MHSAVKCSPRAPLILKQDSIAFDLALPWQIIRVWYNSTGTYTTGRNPGLGPKNGTFKFQLAIGSF